MERRDFIKRAGIGSGILVASAAIAVDAVKNSETLEKGHDQAKESADKLKQRLHDVENKIDQLQSNQKKAVRAGLVLAGLLIGLDLSLVI